MDIPSIPTAPEQSGALLQNSGEHHAPENYPRSDGDVNVVKSKEHKPKPKEFTKRQLCEVLAEAAANTARLLQ